MNIHNLQFPSLWELIDFQTVTKAYGAHLEPKAITLSGQFSDAEIELAEKGFGACLKTTMVTNVWSNATSLQFCSK